MRIVLAVLASLVAAPVASEDLIQLDPFARATSGHPDCAAPAPPLLTREQVERGAHARAERGTRCAMEGKCEPGGAYRRDPEINEAARAAIAGDKRFATSSVWLTTSRGWVTLQGCVRDAAQKRALVATVKAVPRVVQVFDETRAPRSPH